MIMSVLFFIASGLLIVGVDSLRLVKDSTGAQVFRPDGRPLMATDAWATIKAQWQSEVALLLSIAFFIWWVVRLIRLFRSRSQS